jgi:ABC-type transport system involved in multi-copper enzyme maturation permease subunit
MYAWKCWRETRASFIFLLMLSTAPALLVTLIPGIKEQNGWWHFDRSEYTHNPFMMAHVLSTMVISVLWPTGFLSAVFLGATASGGEIEPGTIEYLWTRPRTRTSVTWTHWSVCLVEMVIVAIVPVYLAAMLIGTLTRFWDLSLLLVAPWLMVIAGVPLLGLTTLMTAVRRSGKGGLISTAAVVLVYMIVRQIVIVPLHLNLPTLFSGPVIWLMNNFQNNSIAFPSGSLVRAVLLAAAFPLAAQYLLKRAEV